MRGSTLCSWPSRYLSFHLFPSRSDSLPTGITTLHHDGESARSSFQVVEFFRVKIEQIGHSQLMGIDHLLDMRRGQVLEV